MKSRNIIFLCAFASQILVANEYDKGGLFSSQAFLFISLFIKRITGLRVSNVKFHTLDGSANDRGLMYVYCFHDQIIIWVTFIVTCTFG